MFGLLKTDFSKLKSERFGSGTFGAKTTELDRFKGAAEKAGVIIPPHVSFPLEFFTPALVRSGFLTEAGIYTGKQYQRERDDGNLIEFNSEEKKAIIEAFSRFMNFIVAVRSDELTAKGVGVFSTKFIRITDETLKDGTIFTILSDILADQFNLAANAFKRRASMPHEIGIQVMPLVGNKHGIPLVGRRTIYPDVSLAGFTVLEQNKVIVNVGASIGGGVSKRVIEMEIFSDAEKITNLNESVRSDTAFNYKLGRLNYDAFVEFEIGQIQKLLKITAKRMTQMAQNSGTDIYFEVQTPSVYSRESFLTQVSAHNWPKIEKPSGTEIQLAKNKHTASKCIVGSAVVPCNGVFSILEFAIKNLKTAIAQTSGRLVVTLSYSDTPSELKPGNFGTYEFSAAVLDICSHGSSNFSSHVRGLFRELGIPLINVEYEQKKLKQLDGKQFYLWADELNQKTGIVIPE